LRHLSPERTITAGENGLHLVQSPGEIGRGRALLVVAAMSLGPVQSDDRGERADRGESGDGEGNHQR
jgi:hypothetical protein